MRFIGAGPACSGVQGGTYPSLVMFAWQNFTDTNLPDKLPGQLDERHGGD
ncbi:hypothetical protein [Xenorhabdus siamensis]